MTVQNAIEKFFPCIQTYPVQDFFTNEGLGDMIGKKVSKHKGFEIFI